MRMFLTGSIAEFKFHEPYIQSWSELISFKQRNLKDTESLETTNKLCFSAITIEMIKYCVCVAPYENNMGTLTTPYQMACLCTSIGYFLKYNIKHITEITFLENRRADWIKRNPNPPKNTRAPTVPKYYEWVHGSNFRFCKASINRRYTPNEMMMDIFQPHSCQFNFVYMKKLLDLGLEFLDEETRFSDGLLQDKKDLLNLIKWALDEYSEDVNMGSVDSSRRHRISLKDYATSFLKEQFIKVYTKENVNHKEQRCGSEQDSNEEPSTNEDMDERNDLRKIVDIWMMGFKNIPEKDPDYFWMRKLKTILLKMKPNINFSTITVTEAQLTQEQMISAWQQLSDHLKTKLKSRTSSISNKYISMVDVLAQMAIGKLSSQTSSLSIERLFARLVQHCCGDRFPKISTINDEGRLYCLAFNKLKLAEVINEMPFNFARRGLIRRLDELYPGSACPERPQMNDVIDGDEVVDILTVSYSIFLK